MKEIKIDSEYITLGKFLKYVSAVNSGAIAKMVIMDGKVLVNDEEEKRRGKKLRDGDIIFFDNVQYIVKNEN